MTIPLPYSQALKGIAILGVVTIHVMAFFPNIYASSPSIELSVFLDQLSRLSVPLFIALSGYGLAKSDEKHHVSFLTFLKKRTLKLIPSYLIWTAISLLLLSTIPVWKYAGQTPSLFSLVFLGQADYHLYFIPVIFQLYMLFSILNAILKKYPLLTILFIAIQPLIYLYYRDVAWGERTEYILYTSWIGYFALGIGLAYLQISPKLQKLSLILSILSIFFVSYLSISAMQNGINPLEALKFTRWQLMLYTLPTIIGLTSLSFTKVPALLQLTGKHSFLIYLSHVLLLRIMYALIFPIVAWQLLVFALATWVLGVAATIYVDKKIQ